MIIYFCIFFQVQELYGDTSKDISIGLTMLSSCGNGNKEDYEDCDNTSLGKENDATEKCDSNCKFTYCGDGIIQSPNGREELIEDCEVDIQSSRACSINNIQGTQTCNNCRWSSCQLESKGNSSFFINNNQNKEVREEEFLQIYNVNARSDMNMTEITWNMNYSAKCQLKWGKTVDLMDQILNNLNSSRSYNIKLEKLIPNTIYHFQITCLDEKNVENKEFNSNIYNFRTEKLLGKEIFDQNVSGFEARYNTENDQVILEWTNPIDSRFLAVKILKSHIDYPEKDDSELIIFNDNKEIFHDKNIISGIQYYYTIFAYDNDGNLSSGALTSIVIPKKQKKEIKNIEDLKVIQKIEIAKPNEEVLIKTITQDNVVALKVDNDIFGDKVDESDQVNIIINPIKKNIDLVSKEVDQIKESLENKNIIGDHIYEFKAFVNDQEVRKFEKDITISITYTENQIQGIEEESLAINYYDEKKKKWVVVLSVVDKKNNLIEANVNHFTLFALLDNNPKYLKNKFKKFQYQNQKKQVESNIDLQCSNERDLDINFQDFRFFAGQRNIILNQKNQEINLLSKSEFDVRYVGKDDNISKIIFEISLDDSSKDVFFKKQKYFLKKKDGYFQASLISPSEIGKYDLSFDVSVDDNCQSKLIKKPIIGSLNILESGKILYKDDFLPKSEITIYKVLDNGVTEKWNGENFFQYNPFLSSDGEYGFMVPEGNYFIKVNKSGFFEYKSDNFFVENNIINENINLKKEIKYMNFLKISLFLLIVLFFISKIKKRFKRNDRKFY